MIPVAEERISMAHLLLGTQTRLADCDWWSHAALPTSAGINFRCSPPLPPDGTCVSIKSILRQHYMKEMDSIPSFLYLILLITGEYDMTYSGGPPFNTTCLMQGGDALRTPRMRRFFRRR